MTDATYRRPQIAKVCVICKADYLGPRNEKASRTCGRSCSTALRAWAVLVAKDGVSSYSGAHHKVRKRRGPAKHRACACGRPAREWAYVGPLQPGASHPYSSDVSHYQAMCKMCHNYYDWARVLRDKGVI
ncbi:hypothetical protein [Nocardioides sp. WS12]|uniref:hypothetical protein n=1 Tax=Nocardioides sp. WS12 TaxID=2486272 RepID=UPI0015FDCC6C|nr:hypothetical protein [Nocardioides sp. WS12]